MLWYNKVFIIVLMTFPLWSILHDIFCSIRGFDQFLAAQHQHWVNMSQTAHICGHSQTQWLPFTQIKTSRTCIHTYCTRARTSTPSSPPQKPCSLPCSAKQDKSCSGQTAVYSEVRQKAGIEREERICLPFFSPHPSLLHSSVSMDRRQNKRGIKQETGGKVISRVCECVPYYKAAAVDLSLIHSPTAPTGPSAETQPLQTLTSDLWTTRAHTNVGSLSLTQIKHTRTHAASLSCKQLKQSCR